MNVKKADKTWQIIILVICLTYTLGIGFGFLFADQFNLYPIIKQLEISSNALINNLFFYAKFSLPIWIAGFFAVGIFFTVPWCIVCGCFYGVTAMEFISFGNSLGFFMNVIGFIMFTATIFIFAASSMNLSLNQYKKYNNPKAKLPREQARKRKEHAVFLIIGIILSLIASAIKLYT